MLIENQLEPSDHRHLGQVLTYLAGLGSDGATVVWITTRFREEHRAAIDWLNRQTGDGFDFFGVEIEAIRIVDSLPAPRFNVVAMPNDWTKQARQAVRRATSDAPSEVGLLYQEYWLGLRQEFEQSGGTGRFPKAWPRHWLPFAIGRSGFQLSAGLFRAERQIRFELYMHQNDMPPKLAYRQLEGASAEIEAAYGRPLEWQELPESRASRLAVYLKEADVSDRADWKRQHRWIIDQLKLFRHVFAGRIRSLNLGTSSSLAGEDGASPNDAVRSPDFPIGVTENG